MLCYRNQKLANAYCQFFLVSFFWIAQPVYATGRSAFYLRALGALCSIKSEFKGSIKLPEQEVEFVEFLSMLSGVYDTDRKSDLIERARNDMSFRGWAENNVRSKDIDSKSNIVPSYEAASRHDPAKPKAWKLRFSDLRIRVQNATAWPFSLTDYDRKVLLLKKGDSVCFPDWDPNREFVLGEYLGAGNSNLVFALGNSSVIKIPFTTLDRRLETHYSLQNFDHGFRGLEARGHVASQGGVNAFHVKRELPRYALNLDEVRALGIKVKPVELLGAKGQDIFFVVQERTHGKENGYDFLQRYSGSPEEKLKFDALQRIRKLLEGNSSKFDMGSSPERQFVWDDSEGDWVLVDW